MAYPCEATALAGAVEAAQKGSDRATAGWPGTKIAETAASCGIDLGNLPIVDVPHSHAAAAKAVELIREGKAEILMKGSLHTDELMCGGCLARRRAAHGTSHQPRVHHGRADLSQSVDRD